MIYKNNESVVLGVDIGGTNTVYGIVGKDGNIYKHQTMDTDGSLSASNLVDRINLSVDKFLRKNKKMEIVGVGIGAPNGNHFTGVIEDPPNLNWGKVNIVDLFKKKYDVKIVLTNDANAAALGEKSYGLAKEMDDFIVITLGTGLGSGIFSGGKLVYGHDGFAGEMGHMVIDSKGRDCNCGNQGCLESYVSANGIKKTIEVLFKKYPDDKLLNQIRIKGMDGELLDNEFDCGNQMAGKIYEITGDSLGLGLAQAATLLNPEAFIFYGGISKAGDRILKFAKRSMDNHLLKVQSDTIKLLYSALPGGKAGVLGAASLIWSPM